MAGFDYSLAFMVPDAHRAEANRLACALGHDQLPGNTFSVGLSADGSEPATHWACHSWVQEIFIKTLFAAGEGHLPEVIWSDFELTEKEVFEILSKLVSSEPQTSFLDFNEWITSKNLMKIEPRVFNAVSPRSSTTDS